MNKFITITIFACMCASAIASPVTNLDEELPSEFALGTSLDQEIKGLKGQLQEFEDFCVSSRDWVLNQIKQSTNGLTANVFKIVFTSVEDLGRDVVEVQKDATKKLGKQLANPSGEVEAPEDDIGQIIANGQSDIKKQGTPAALITALKTVLSATKSKVSDLIYARINALQEVSSLQQLSEGFKTVCESIRTYENSIKDQFNEYKGVVLNNKPEYRSMTLNDVPCATSTKIIRAEGFCRLVTSTGELLG